jgi:hypothetical protein
MKPPAPCPHEFRDGECTKCQTPEWLARGVNVLAAMGHFDKPAKPAPEELPLLMPTIEMSKEELRKLYPEPASAPDISALNDLHKQAGYEPFNFEPDSHTPKRIDANYTLESIEAREWRVIQETDNPESLKWIAGEFVEKSAYDALKARSADTYAHYESELEKLKAERDELYKELLLRPVTDYARELKKEIEQLRAELAEARKLLDATTGDAMCARKERDEARAEARKQARDAGALEVEHVRYRVALERIAEYVAYPAQTIALEALKLEGK